MQDQSSAAYANEKSEHEAAERALLMMQDVEECMRPCLITVVAENGTIFSSTNIDRVKSFEQKCAHMGVEIKQRINYGDKD